MPNELALMTPVKNKGHSSIGAPGRFEGAVGAELASDDGCTGPGTGR